MDIIGSIPNIEIGQSFADRQELHNRNIHRGLMRGIAPRGLSIVMSGGYIDDEDQGDLVIYTGEGGRDVKSQIKSSQGETFTWLITAIMEYPSG